MLREDPPAPPWARARSLAAASILTLALVAAFSLGPRFPLSDFDMFGLGEPHDGRVAVRTGDGRLHELDRISALHCLEGVSFTPRGVGLCVDAAPDPDREGPQAELLRQRSVSTPLTEVIEIVRQVRHLATPRGPVDSEICVLATCTARMDREESQ